MSEYPVALPGKVVHFISKERASAAEKWIGENRHDLARFYESFPDVLDRNRILGGSSTKLI